MWERQHAITQWAPWAEECLHSKGSSSQHKYPNNYPSTCHIMYGSTIDRHTKHDGQFLINELSL